MASQLVEADIRWASGCWMAIHKVVRAPSVLCDGDTRRVVQQRAVGSSVGGGPRAEARTPPELTTADIIELRQIGLVRTHLAGVRTVLGAVPRQ